MIYEYQNGRVVHNAILYVTSLPRLSTTMRAYVYVYVYTTLDDL